MKIDEIKYWKVKSLPLSGTTYRDVNKQAKIIFAAFKRQTKRNIYIRSIFFKKQKVFFENFHEHLRQKKNFADRTRRLKFLACGIELIKNSTYSPVLKENPRQRLYRFYGETLSGRKFAVQIKEDISDEKKQFMSVFGIR